ncbi:MAG: hypothetical protein QM726_24285 [Chitinophagaceae bacterium]
MHFDEFSKSVKEVNPPDKLNTYALSLWYDAKGDWEKAHTIIQDVEDANAAWIHAYLHRKEGDRGNAGYWYSRAGKRMPAYSLTQEWEEIARAII